MSATLSLSTKLHRPFRFGSNPLSCCKTRDRKTFSSLQEEVPQGPFFHASLYFPRLGGNGGGEVTLSFHCWDKSARCLLCHFAALSKTSDKVKVFVFISMEDKHSSFFSFYCSQSREPWWPWSQTTVEFNELDKITPQSERNLAILNVPIIH